MGAGKITAGNVVYTLVAGSGITVTSGQNPTITNTGVLSLQDKTGDIDFSAGSGITIDGLTFTNSDKGSAQNIFKTIAVSGQTSITAGSNSDTLTFAGSGGITVTTDATNKVISIAGTGGTTQWTTSGLNIYYTTGNVGIGSTSPTQALDVVGNFKLSGTTTLNGITYTWPGSLSNGYVLQTNGSGTLSWVDPASFAGVQYLQLNNGALSPANITNDLLLGATSTGSALVRLAGTSGGNSFINTGGNIGLGTTSSLFKVTTGGAIGTVAEGDIFSQYDSGDAASYPVIARYFTNNGSYPGGTYIFGSGTNGYVGIEKPGGGDVTKFQVKATKSTFNGNVGIGSTDPQAKLDVSGQTLIGNGDKTGKSTFPLYISDSSNLGWKVADSTGVSKFELYTGFGGVNQMRLLGGVTLAGYSQALTLGTDLNASALTIAYNSAGNVGIGSTSPNNLLDVAGNIGVGGGNIAQSGAIRLPNNVNISYRNAANNADLVAVNLDSSNNFNFGRGVIMVNGGGGSNTLFVGSNNGNVGIGSTSPIGKFNVEGAATGKALVTLNQTGNQAVFTASISGTTKFIIDNGGNVGIGTAVPAYPAAIFGTAPDVANGRILDLDGTLSSSTNDQSGFKISPSISPASNTARTYSGGVFSVSGNSTTKLTSATIRGFDAQSSFSGASGTLGTAVGGRYVIFNTNTGTISNAYGIHIDTPTNAGTITNTRGIYLASQTVGTQTNNPYGIYQEGTTDYNYFAGRIGIGTTSPQGLLNINGAVTGKALVSINQTGDQDLFTASTSGTTKFTVDNSGRLYLADSTAPSVTTNKLYAVSGSLYWNGTAMTSSQWTTVASTDIYFSTGNVGIGITNPSNKLTLNSPVTSDSNATAIFTATSASFKPLVLQGFTSQTANLLELQDPTGTLLSGFDNTGKLTVTDNFNTIPSYTNTGATGNRSSMITVTTNLSITTGAVANLVDGTTTNTTGVRFTTKTLNSSDYVQFDFGSQQLVTEIRLHNNCTLCNMGTWQIQGSNDAASWTNIGSTVDLAPLSSDPRLITQVSSNSVAYRYYRFQGVSGSLNASAAYWDEVEFKLAAASSNGNSVLAGGLLGVGTSNLTHKLNVSGTVVGKALSMFNDTGGNDILTASASGSTKFVISNNGNVGIGTALPGYILDVQHVSSKINSKNGYLTNGADYAEYLENEEAISPHSVVGLNRATGKVRTYQTGDILMGVVSEGIGFVGNGNKDVERDPHFTLVGLVGQLVFDPAQVTISNGQVLTKDNKVIGSLLANGKVLISQSQPSSSLANNDYASLKTQLNDLRAAVLGASLSASVMPLDPKSLDIDSATIGGQLNVLGRTTLTDLGVTGTINAGLLTIDGLNGKLDSIGQPLRLQSLASANIELENGQVVIDIKGNITTQGVISAHEVKTTKLTIIEPAEASTSAVITKSLGTVTIKAGQSSVAVTTKALTGKSLIFVTPDVPVAIASKKVDSDTFNVTLAQPAAEDITVNWWIVN